MFLYNSIVYSVPTSPSPSSMSTESINRFTKNRTSNKQIKHKNYVNTNNKSPVHFDIGKPFEFKLVTHVEYDKKTNRLIGLPPEWQKILEGDYLFKDDKQSTQQKQQHPPLQKNLSNIQEKQPQITEPVNAIEK